MYPRFREQTPKVQPLKYYGFLGRVLSEGRHITVNLAGAACEIMSPKGFYPHSLWIVSYQKLLRAYDLLQFLMGRNLAIFLLGDGVS